MRFTSVALLLLTVCANVHAAEKIARDVYLIRGTLAPGKQPDGNTVVFVNRRGLIVVDSGRHAAHTQQIIDFARERKLPVRAVINTHWHLDHIGGNAMLRRAYPGVKIYASSAFEGATKGFLKNYRDQLTQMISTTKDDAQKEVFRVDLSLIDAADQLKPDVVIVGSGRKSIDGRPLEIRLQKTAVTEGDVWIRDPASGVVVAGDLVTIPAPFLDTACPKGWRAALDDLAKTDFKLLVPGHGPALTRAQFETYRTAFERLLECEGPACASEWTTAIRPLFSATDEEWLRGGAMDYYVALLRNGDHAARYCE